MLHDACLLELIQGHSAWRLLARHLIESVEGHGKLGHRLIPRQTFAEPGCADLQVDQAAEEVVPVSENTFKLCLCQNGSLSALGLSVVVTTQLVDLMQSTNKALLT